MIKAVTGTIAAMTDLWEALAVAESYPKKDPSTRGPGFHVPIPDVYAPDAPGWSAHVCDPPVAVGDGTAVLLLPERAQALSVRTVRSKGKDVTIDFSGAVDVAALPQKFRSALAPTPSVALK